MNKTTYIYYDNDFEIVAFSLTEIPGLEHKFINLPTEWFESFNSCQLEPSDFIVDVVNNKLKRRDEDQKMDFSLADQGETYGLVTIDQDELIKINTPHDRDMVIIDDYEAYHYIPVHPIGYKNDEDEDVDFIVELFEGSIIFWLAEEQDRDIEIYISDAVNPYELLCSTMIETGTTKKVIQYPSFASSGKITIYCEPFYKRALCYECSTNNDI